LQTFFSSLLRVGPVEFGALNLPPVFWYRHWSRKTGAFVAGPWQQRQNLMATLGQQTGVRPFGFPALRHFGASRLDSAKVTIGSSQRLPGHENRTITEFSLHSLGEAERAAMAVYAQACQEPHPEASPNQSQARQKKRGEPIKLTP
jgi:hypothetical protein